MEYRLLGRTGVRVSELCLGTMTFGNEADEKRSFAMMDLAIERGVNFFDTANIYSRGASEEIVGRWLNDRGADVVVATKAHFPTGGGPNDSGNSRLHLVRSVENSLKRLGRECVEVFYLHHWDAETAIEESLAAISHLIDQGKVLYAGVSNFSAWQTMKTLGAAAQCGFSAPVVIQPQYNLVKRLAEVEILPLAADQSLAVCPYSPIAAGLLSGKYQREETGRIHVNTNYTARFENQEYWDISDRFVAFAAEHGLEPAALAVRWVSTHPQVTAPIIGARNEEQLRGALSSLDIDMDSELREEISGLSVEPPTATERERMDFVLRLERDK